jgi:hypothetical protein
MDVGSLFKRIRNWRNWLSQANVRSTTHRHLPSPLPWSVLPCASSGWMRVARNLDRIFAAS